MEKPQWLTDFERPKNTEIKCINQKYYLYECHSVFDKEKGRAKKVSGTYLGRITPDGFVPKREVRKPVKDPHIGNLVQVGAAQFCWNRTADMRERLQVLFPDLWQQIYVMAILKATGNGRFRRMRANYEDSVLSVVFPGLPLSGSSITSFLQDLGRRGEAIQEYMKRGIEPDGDFILIDGHRLLSASKGVLDAEKGYDSKRRYKPQINLLYLFSKSCMTGRPIYYQNFQGSTVDSKAVRFLVKSLGVLPEKCMLIMDKGCGSDDIFCDINEAGIYYGVPLKRGNRFTAGRDLSESAFEGLFTYHGRPIRYKLIRDAEPDVTICIYKDLDLYSEEIKDLTIRIQKKNDEIVQRRAKETERRKKGNGQLSDDAYEKLIPVLPAEEAKKHPEMGVITLRTNHASMDPVELYEAYKQREAIEELFKTYDNTLNMDASYMRCHASLNAWLFLNHLSISMCIDGIEEIRALGESKNISWEDLRTLLRKIRVVQIDEKWHLAPIKNDVQRMLDKLHLDTKDFMQLLA